MQVLKRKHSVSLLDKASDDYVLSALIHEGPNLAVLRRDNPEKLGAAIMGLLADVVGSVNVGKNMNPLQIKAAVQIIARDYFFLKIPELEQCFIHGVTGKYGPLYDKMDVNTLCTWLIKYQQERDVACEEVRADQKFQNNIYDIFAELPGEKNRVLEIMRDVNAKTPLAKKVYIPKISDEARAKQAKIAEFNIWIENQWHIRINTSGISVDVDENQKKFIRIKYRGQQMTKEDFAQFKWNQLTQISNA